MLSLLEYLLLLLKFTATKIYEKKLIMKISRIFLHCQKGAMTQKTSHDNAKPNINRGVVAALLHVMLVICPGCSILKYD